MLSCYRDGLNMHRLGRGSTRREDCQDFCESTTQADREQGQAETQGPHSIDSSVFRTHIWRLEGVADDRN